MSSSPAQEFGAIQAIHAALEPLPEDGRTRVLNYIVSLLGIDAKVSAAGPAPAPRAPVIGHDNDGEGASDEAAPAAPPKGALSFGTFAELYAAAEPKTNAEKALVVGYWLQVCQVAESFTAAAANKELTHLGHKLSNITDAIDQMKSQKPMLILQLKKSGSSQQARKLYKVSHEGVKRVEAMVRG
ncbi:hypothetical protein ACFJGW_20700 [Burkholderiaceae bacterium UC74_6]